MDSDSHGDFVLGGQTVPPCVRVLAHGGGRTRLVVQSVRVRDGGVRGVRLSHGRGMHGGHSVLVLLPVHALPADTGRGGSRARAADVVLLGARLNGLPHPGHRLHRHHANHLSGRQTSVPRLGGAVRGYSSHG